jgi:RecG-like helicase
VSLWHRLTASRAQQEAEELQRHALAEHSTPISACRHGEVASVSGTIRSVTVRPKAQTPALEVEVYDGTGAVRVVWLGRRSISGIDPGRRVTVHGRITCPATMPTIFNPRYELKPSP